MSHLNRILKLSIGLCLILADLSAVYPLPYYGTKSRGMGGVGVALPQDSLVSAYNPAGLAFIEDRYDLGLDYLKRRSDFTIRGNALPANNGHYNSAPDTFIPEAGIKRDYNGVSVGLSSYSRGTVVNYGRTIPLLGTSKARVAYTQMFVKPSMAYRINCNHAIGIGVDFVLSQLKVHGIQNFRAGSVSPDHVSNKGYDYEPGAGFHIGWIGRFFNRLKVGVSYETEIFAHRFSKYRGLFQHGKANSCPILLAGFSYDVNSRLVVAFDYERFFWKETPAFSHPFTLDEPTGANNGPGFGWRNINQYKFGGAYRINDQLTFRMGAIRSNHLFAPTETLNNFSNAILTISQITTGFTWMWGQNEINVAYVHGYKEKTKGRNSIPLVFGGGEGNLKNVFDWFSVSLGHPF